MNIYLFQPLDEANLADLKVALKGFLQKGETIKLDTQVLDKYTNSETHNYIYSRDYLHVLTRVYVMYFP